MFADFNFDAVFSSCDWKNYASKDDFDWSVLQEEVLSPLLVQQGTKALQQILVELVAMLL